MRVDALIESPQFTLSQPDKERQLVAEMRDLTAHHRARCPDYSRLVAAVARSSEISRLADLPFLPVTMFKSHPLQSIPSDEVFKVMTSSGTSGQQPSRVILDRPTAARQARALAAIMTTVLGPKRLPMIVLDTRNVVRDRREFNARGAAVLGMANFGHHHFYALDEDMKLDLEGVQRYLERYRGETILLYGFTYIAWQHFLHPVVGKDLDLSNAVLVHSGGWKTLTDQAVGKQEFKRQFRQVTGISRIHNFYGMVEQTGSIFLEGQDGFLYPPNFGDVIIRDPETWEEAPYGAPGVIQVLSALPTSYPGHSLLTEDLGVVQGIGEPQSGWGGKKLEVLGRVPRTELRGCSDVYAAPEGGLP